MNSSSSNVSSDFSKFVTENNVVGLALGIIMAQSSIEFAKNLTNDIVKPIVRYTLHHDEDLIINKEDVISDLIMLIFTITIIYIFSRSFGINTSSNNLSVFMNAN